MEIYVIYIIIQDYLYDILKLFRVIFLSYCVFLCRCFAIHFIQFCYIFGIKNFFFPVQKSRISKQVYRKKCFLSLSEKFNYLTTSFFSLTLNQKENN